MWVCGGEKEVTFKEWWKSSSIKQRMEKLKISEELASLDYEELDEGILDLLVIGYIAGGR